LEKQKETIMPEVRDFIEVLAIISQDGSWGPFLGTAADEGFNIQRESDLEQGQKIIKREGYRFQIVFVDEGFVGDVTEWVETSRVKYPWLAFARYGAGAGAYVAQKDSTAQDITQTAQYLNVGSKAEIPGDKSGGPADPESIISIALELLHSARSQLDSMPEPPYRAGKTRFLEEAGPLLFSISLTERPWALEGDVFTLPVNNLGGVGNLGTAWIKELGSEAGSKLKKELARKDGAKIQIAPKRPVHQTFDYMDGTAPRKIKLILATSATAPAASVMSAVEAHLAVIDLATSLAGCQTLILPLIGGGSAGLPSDEIVRGVLEEFDSGSPLGELKHVIFTVYEPDIIDTITSARSKEIVRVQRLVNDLPSGPDRLRIESETRALADAIALKEMHPPMVVGILGGWGTGKSFVLHLIKERLRQLRSWDLSEEDMLENFPYVGHPYLVHFDAWTYAKSDLWASLMQRILLDLDQQLNLEQTIEKAKAGLLCKGVDIWELMEDLTAKQCADLQKELGAEAIAAFQGWKNGRGVAKSLWGVLEELRKQELKDLNDAKQKLSDAELRHEKKVARIKNQYDTDVEKQKQDLEQELVKKNSALQIKLANMQAALETARLTAIAQADSEVEAEARKEAWEPVVFELKDFLGKTADQVLQKAGVKDGDAPPSIFKVVKEVKLTTKYFKGLIKSETGIALLVFAVASPFLVWLLSQIDVVGLWSIISGAAGILGGLLGSMYTVLTKLNRTFEEKQAAYEKRIGEARKQRDSRRSQLLQQKLESDVRPIENNIQQLKDTTETAIAQLEADTQSRIDELTTDQIKELETIEKHDQEIIDGLKGEVEKHQLRAGITGRSKSLLDLVQARRDSKLYDEQLGLLHQVQEDLQELTDALLPVNGIDHKIFPRGQPRIILIVDDLDRCPPEQVVRMLEAAQLLVRTKLFVVVLAMDVRYVTRALEKKYDRILFKDGDPSGLDYVEKIVQVPYRVPGIAPGVMRSFLQGQMDVVEEITKPPSATPSDGAQQTFDVPIPGSGNPVFESTYDPEVEVTEEPLPTRVQQFDEKELSLLTASCNAATVSPRAGRRLVNVFKLLKIIWYYRGLHREPTYEVKQVMMFLLALSTAQPLIMRHVLHFLEEEYRKGNEAKKFVTILRNCLTRSEEITKRPQTHKLLRDLIKSQGDLPQHLTLEMIDLENIRLVKSFSFVGEVESEKQAREDAKTGQTPSPSETAGTLQKKPRTAAQRRKTSRVK
jgi:hypothetical protein